MPNTQIPEITVNGKTLEELPDTTSTVTKLRDLIKLRPYQVIEINREKSRYGDRIVRIKDLDEECELKVYMPERMEDKCYPGTVFVYNGKIPLNNGSGHTYHDVRWFKCKQ